MQTLYAETYIRDGASPWLVFLHGFGGSTNMWRKQLVFFRQHYNLLLLDLPGHGRSREGVAAMGARQFEDVADVVVNTIRSRGIHKACFICASLGTMVFAAIQSRYPDLVTGAILCGAVAGVSLGWQLVLSVLDRTKRFIPHDFLLKAFAHVLLPLKGHSTSRRFFIESGRQLERSEFLAWFTLIVRNLDMLKKRNAHLKNVLFISGTEDFTFLRKLIKALRSRSDLQLTLLGRCGHVCSLQRPREFNSLTQNYLNRILPPPIENPHCKETHNYG